MTDFLKIAKSIVVHFAHICAYGVETVKKNYHYSSLDILSFALLFCYLIRLRKYVTPRKRAHVAHFFKIEILLL